MNVTRGTISKKCSRGKRGKFKNFPVFNTYFYSRTSADQPSVTSLLSSSECSAIQPCGSSMGRVLGTADRNRSSSHSTVFQTPNPFMSIKKRTKSGEPDITNEFLADAFRTPEVPATTNSSSSKISNQNKQILKSLPPPSSGVRGQKPRSSTSSGGRPQSTSTRTPRTPKTTISSLESSHHITVAITEGRGLARGEVGLAAMDVYRPHMVLCQISDSQTYTNTLTKINIIHPVEILVPNTFVENQQPSKLFSLIHEAFPQVAITTLQRRHFSDSAGLQQVQSLCLPEYANVELVVTHKFYALAAAAALLKFSEFMKNIIFTPKSLKIEYQSPENVMNIDMKTAQKLELVLSQGEGEVQGSLLGVLDHCCTTSGKRSLRANILQPSTKLELINSRLLSVTELAQNPALLHSIQSTVSKFMNVEQLLWLCVQLPGSRDEQRASELQTNYVLLLKTTLESLPALRDSLLITQTPYFQKVMQNLEDDRFALLLANILEAINEDARTQKGFSASQFQRCFAIKTGVNGLLDMARSSYSDLVSKMHENIQNMAEEFNLPLRASTTGNKGLHIQIKLARNTALSAKDLPGVFIQVARTRNMITCTTEELVVLNHRMKPILQEIQIMSNVIMQELMRKLRENIGCLYRLCENIAELDVILSFAQVSSADKFVPPTFGDKMDLKESRHPILDVISPSTPVANDVFASADKNFNIITGPNMGGKSIYIKQVALLQIMAQVGCFVPAESAEFRISKQIFSRLGFDDSIEYNASSFVLEMQEMHYILRSLDSCGLVLVDELCRSTDHEEGTAIAWVLCEQLLQTKAFTFFTTHYLFLTKLQTLYPNVANHQMLVEESGSSGRLVYTHRLVPGVTQVVLYGLRLAKVCGLPEATLQRATELCESLAHEKLAEPVHVQGTSEAEEDQEYIQELMNLIQINKFNLDEVKHVQAKLKQRYGMEQNKEPTTMQGTDSITKQGGKGQSDAYIWHKTDKGNTSSIAESTNESFSRTKNIASPRCCELVPPTISDDIQTTPIALNNSILTNVNIQNTPSSNFLVCSTPKRPVQTVISPTEQQQEDISAKKLNMEDRENGVCLQGHVSGIVDDQNDYSPAQSSRGSIVQGRLNSLPKIRAETNQSAQKGFAHSNGKTSCIIDNTGGGLVPDFAIPQSPGIILSQANRKSPYLNVDKSPRVINPNKCSKMASPRGILIGTDSQRCRVENELQENASVRSLHSVVQDTINPPFIMTSHHNEFKHYSLSTVNLSQPLRQTPRASTESLDVDANSAVEQVLNKSDQYKRQYSRSSLQSHNFNQNVCPAPSTYTYYKDYEFSEPDVYKSPSSRLLAGNSESWLNERREENRLINANSFQQLQMDSQSPYRRLSRIPTPLSETSNNQSQPSTSSNTPMVLNLVPNFETIPRTMGSGSIADVEEHNMFEE